MSSCADPLTPLHELRITRLIHAPREAVWRAWTDHLAEWWCPAPWTVDIVEQDARPGGRSAVIMRGPEGEVMPQEGVFLEIVPMERIVFTDAFTKGWIPTGPFIVGFMEFADEAGKTRYSAGARHWTEEACAQHEAMGFTVGWSKVAEQLEVVARRIA